MNLKHKVYAAMALWLAAGLWSCSTSPFLPQFFTLTIHQEANREVRLLTGTDWEPRGGFSHPVDISSADMAATLNGLVIEEEATALPLLGRGGSDARHRAFSQEEIEFLAPLLAKGLSQATPDEMVTFFVKADAPPLHHRITSGGVFVEGEAVHILLSNYRVKTLVRQDSEDYQAPFRLQPLKPIRPEPIRLLFYPTEYMGVVQRSGLVSLVAGNQPEVAILFKRLLAGQARETP